MYRRNLAMLTSLVVAFFPPMTQSAFLSQSPTIPFVRSTHSDSVLHMSSFVGDGSDYSSKDSDLDVDEDALLDGPTGGYCLGSETPTIELQPVPMSKNAGSRFVAFVWDKQLDTEGRDALDLHYDRIGKTEDHVMFCRKVNLYNETFNTDSMVDILWSYPM